MGDRTKAALSIRNIAVLCYHLLQVGLCSYRLVQWFTKQGPMLQPNFT